MKHSKLKLMLAIIIFSILIVSVTSIFATNEKIQILQKANEEYMIYIQNHLEESFEFAFSNDKNANKEELSYRNAATDTAEEGANYIAYVDENLYKMYFAQSTYLWARSLDGTCFVEGIEVQLNDSITDEEAELANNITKIIQVDTTQILNKPTEIINGVETTKTVGKVAVQEEGTTYYQLLKVPNDGKYSEFIKLAEKISNNQIQNNIYSKLEVAKEFSKLYQELVPATTDANWTLVENNEILQPEEAKDDEQYILWLKNENGNNIKLDVQFLNCFEDYKKEVISEKVTTKLPVTADDPTLFIILAALVVALIVVLIIRKVAIKKDNTSKN